MGIIHNEFTVLELVDSDYQDNQSISAKDLLESMISKYPNLQAFVTEGSNQTLFISIHPSGSKMGWATYNSHKEQVDNFIALIGGKFKSAIIKYISTVDESCVHY